MTKKSNITVAATVTQQDYMQSKHLSRGAAPFIEYFFSICLVDLGCGLSDFTAATYQEGEPQ